MTNTPFHIDVLDLGSRCYGNSNEPPVRVSVAGSHYDYLGCAVTFGGRVNGKAIKSRTLVVPGATMGIRHQRIDAIACNAGNLRYVGLAEIPEGALIAFYGSLPCDFDESISRFQNFLHNLMIELGMESPYSGMKPKNRACEKGPIERLGPIETTRAMN